MARNTQDQLQKLKTFMDSLPDEARSKCSLCTTTLTHIVKQAEAETGVGTATVTRALAEQINETALPADRVTEGQLRDRVRRSAGEKESGRTAQIKKMTKAEKIMAVDNLVAGGMTDLDAITSVAKGTGRAGREKLWKDYHNHCSRRQKEELKAASASTDRLVPREELKEAVADHFKKGAESRALRFAEQAIGVLENIADDDPDREEAFGLVSSWMLMEVKACSSK